MPFTPFLGLSVLIHMFIILGHKVFGSGTTVGVLTEQRINKSTRAGVGFIVMLVSGVVVFTAGSLVKASILDKNSSINLAEQLVGNVSNMYFNGDITYSSALPLVNAEAMAQQNSTCQTAQDTVSDYAYSLVDYLQSKRLNVSFEARKHFADINNIKNYKGTSKQNLLLLDRLVDSESCKS